jgi:limonene-1,2-epoxide hydrolase
MAVTESEGVIDRFIAAWERRDVDELLDFFTEDAVWHVMPMKPAVGKPAIRTHVEAWLRTQPQGVVHRQVSNGNVVMHERTDRCTFGGREIEGPVAAVFEVKDGRITAWREYVDMTPFRSPG